MGSDDDRRAGRAKAEAERKETEELLAGFDRPGRTPRPPGALRDFVDYHEARRSSEPARRPPANRGATAPLEERSARKPAQKEVATFILPERRSTPRRWLVGGVLLLLMPVFGGGLAYCLLSQAGPTPVPVATTAPRPSSPASARTTAPPPPSLSSSTPDSGHRDDPGNDTDAAPAASAGPRPRASGSGPAASSDPRVDFIRNL
jgi:hypothetical protein